VASRFWVSGTGTWDNSDTSHWSATSGGSSGASVPGSSDTVTFDGNSGGGTCTKNSNTTIVSLTMGAFTGTLDYQTNNNTLSVGTVSLTGTGTRTLKIGTGTWTVTGTGAGVWDATDTTNLTFNVSTGLITFSGVAPTFAGGGLTYYNVTFSNVNGTITFGGANTFNNLTFTQNATGAISGVNMSADITVNGVFTATGVDTGGLRLVFTISTSVGLTFNPTRTITVNGSVSFTSVCFNFIASAGSAGTWTGTRMSDGTGNSGITFDSPRTLYWVGTGATWTTLSKWSTTSGGSAATTVPLAQDTAIFDANSAIGASNTVTFSGRYIAKDIDFTGVPNAATLTIAFNANVTICGSLTMATGMVFSSAGNTLRFAFGSSTSTLTMNSVVFSANLAIETGGTSGSLTLADAVTLSGSSNQQFLHRAGTLNVNNVTVTAGLFNSSVSNTRTINMGSGTMTLTGTGTVWTTNTTTNLTFNRDTSTIKFTNTTATQRLFAGGGATFYNFWHAGGAGGATLEVRGNNTFADFKDDGTAAHTILFGQGQTQTFTTWSDLSGSSGNVITINSSDGAGSASTSTHTLKAAGGLISCDYLNIQHSIASPGVPQVKTINGLVYPATWYAGANSTNNQGDATAGSGWVFTVPPANYVKTVNGTLTGLIKSINDLAYS